VLSRNESLIDSKSHTEIKGKGKVERVERKWTFDEAS
jgi:hypothetical protein